MAAPAAKALARPMISAGFEVADGGAALLDLSGAPERAADVRQRYATVVGLLAADAPVPPDAEALDAVVRLPDAATDLPQLLRSLIRAAEDRSVLQRQAGALAAPVDALRAPSAGGAADRLLAQLG